MSANYFQAPWLRNKSQADEGARMRRRTGCPGAGGGTFSLVQAPQQQTSSLDHSPNCCRNNHSLGMGHQCPVDQDENDPPGTWPGSLHLLVPKARLTCALGSTLPSSGEQSFPNPVSEPGQVLPAPDFPWCSYPRLGFQLGLLSLHQLHGTSSHTYIMGPSPGTELTKAWSG